MKLTATIGLIGLFLFLIVIRQINWQENQVFHWDKAGYYVYLPAAFIYNDIDNLEFYPEMNRKYKLTSSDIDYYATYRQEKTGKLLNKYSIGVAVLELPFFLLGHLVTLATKEYPPDGFSTYYQLSVYLASVAWVMFGLVMLYRILARYFSERVTSSVICLVAIGTNLFYYTTFDAGMSHAFSFALFATCLNCADLFYKRNKPNYLIVAAVFFGLIVITRPTNAVVGVVLLLWGIGNKQDILGRIQLLKKQAGAVAVAFLAFVAVLMIQLGYWKFITGQWIHFSYEEEGFNFLAPEIWNGLMSYRKGWFVYTPLALVGIIGLINLWKTYPKLFTGIIIYLVLNIYIVFSWHQWYYGGGFGSRALIESYAVLSIPLACFIAWVFSARSKVLKTFVGLIFVGCVALNLWQSYQFSLGTIPWDHNNKEYYWRVFLKKHRSEEDWKLLGL